MIHNHNFCYIISSEKGITSWNGNNTSDFKVLLTDDKRSFVKLLASLIVYIYRFCEHKNITNPRKPRKNQFVLKKFSFDDFPFTYEMNRTLRSNHQFKADNPDINFDEHFQIDVKKQCTSIGKWDIHIIFVFFNNISSIYVI